MENSIFSSMEMDAIGEIMNISLGSSATAVSNMLDHRVDITTPLVSLETVRDFSLVNLQPAMGVEIKYVSGLDGSNILLMKMSDIKVIVDILLGSETPDEEFELNELTISAVCEVMNQMMGAAATALSDFLGRLINISTPEALSVDDLDDFKHKRFSSEDELLVVVRFSLSIEDALESEFMNVMPVSLAKDLVSGFGLESEKSHTPSPSPEQSAGSLSQTEIENLMQSTGSESTPAPPPSSEQSSGPLSQADIEHLMQSMGDESASAPPPEPSSGPLSQAEIERLMQSMGDEGTSESAPPPPSEQSSGPLSQAEIERLMQSAGNEGTPTPPPPSQSPVPPPTAPPSPQQPTAGSVPPGYPPSYGQGYPGYPPGYMSFPPGYMFAPPEMYASSPNPKVIETQPPQMPTLEQSKKLNEEQAQNLDLIMSVPLEVTVEIGRTRRKVQDILSFSKGSLVVLDKLAGDQVDLFVNGKCIARGDVVVIDDNFGIRITEILQNNGLEGFAQLRDKP